MRLVIIGAVAAGTSAAAKARRNDEAMEITVYEKDRHISYSGCGMPYYLGGKVNQLMDLAPRDPQFFRDQYNVDVRIHHQVLEINAARKTLLIMNLQSGEEFHDRYDQLIIATGAQASFPPIPGIDGPGVFGLRTIGDLIEMDRWIRDHNPRKAVIIGTGFIGMEVCENLTEAGLSVTLVEKEPQVNPGLDADVARYIEEHLREKGVELYLGAQIETIDDQGVRLTDGTNLPSDLTLVATGVRPDTALAQKAGVALGVTGAIRVDNRMKTSVPDIYACGDCVELIHRVTGDPVYAPLGSTANKTGRVAGDVVSGGQMTFPGIVGTSIYRVFDRTIARTGLTETEARRRGLDLLICHNIKPHRPEYLGGREMLIKAVADASDGRLLGAQIIGEEGVDKRIDVLATALCARMTAEDLMHLDLAYAPPFSSTKDPVIYTGMILEGQRQKKSTLYTTSDLEKLKNNNIPHMVIDARKKEQFDVGHVHGAINLDLQALRKWLDSHPEEWSKEIPVITYCNKGTTGNAAYNILRNRGFSKAVNLSGGYRNYRLQMEKSKPENRE